MAEEKRNRRHNDFLQRLSYVLVGIAALGGFMILIDPQVTLTLGNGATLKFGSDGFSQELKGAVVTTMLLGALTAVVSFWFGASKQGQDNAQSVQRIAENAPLVAANVVANAAAPSGDIKAATVNVDADTANVNSPKDKP